MILCFVVHFDLSQITVSYLKFHFSLPRLYGGVARNYDCALFPGVTFFSYPHIISFSGIFTAAIALFTDLDVLLDLVSIGTLFVFYMVANAVIYRRYVAIGTTNPWPTLSFLCSFSFTSIMFSLTWNFVPTGRAKAGLLSACAVIAVAILQLFHCMVPQARKPEFWGVPLMPWIPSISIFLNVFLLGTLDGPSYVRFGFFSAVAVLVYVLYSVHASFDAEGDGSLIRKNGEVHVESRECEDQIFKV